VVETKEFVTQEITNDLQIENSFDSPPVENFTSTNVEESRASP
jgi:hypothetical protein